MRLCFKFGFAGQIANKANKTCKKITYFDLGVQHHATPNTQTHKHTMYFNLATQGANLRGKHSHKNKNKFQPPTINQNRPPKYRANLHHSKAQNRKSKMRKNNLILFKFTGQNHANLKQNTQEYFD